MMIAAVLAVAAGCKKYDDTDLKNRVSSLESRVAKLEELCKQMNTNISSLQTLVTAMQNNDWITSVTPIVKDGKEIGYTITFAKNSPITIFHGDNGSNGSNGNDGQNGQNGSGGSSGTIPQIGIKWDSDGVCYWTLNGEWLTDELGNKVRASAQDGRDGLVPLMKIEDDLWYVSYDGGQTWQYAGKAVGESIVGDSIFAWVDTSDPDYVLFRLADGEEFRLPRTAASEQGATSLSIIFDTEDLVAMRPNSVREIGYTVESSLPDISVEVISSADIRAEVIADSASAGKILVETSAEIDRFSRVVVLVSNGVRTIMKSISFEESQLRITDGEERTVPYQGGKVEIGVETNVDYTISIPQQAQEWIAHIDTRAWRSETIVFDISENSGGPRNAVVEILDGDGFLLRSCKITQLSLTPVETNQIYYRTNTHNIIQFSHGNGFEDYPLPGKFGEGVNVLFNTYNKELDMGTIICDAPITEIGENTFNYVWGNYTNPLTQIYLPSSVKSIGPNAFYKATNLTDINIPEAVEIIDGHAFYWCGSLKSIDIPANVHTIGEGAFTGCMSLESVTLHEGLVVIDVDAFRLTPALAEIVIPKSVESIRRYAFNNDSYSNRRSVYLQWETPIYFIDATTFSIYTTLYVPEEYLEVYQQWKTNKSLYGTIVGYKYEN